MMRAACVLAALMSVAVSFAQDVSVTVSGQVTDEDGYAVPGAVVMASGEDRTAAVTDIDGKWSMTVPYGTKSLNFSCLGMETLDVELAGRSIVNVVMRMESIGLDEAVAVGYGTMIKRELSSSVASVKSDVLTERASAFNVMQSLAGKVAGVRNVSFSGRPGGKSTLRIRGMGSINAGSDPIYVMDGVVDVDPSLVNPSDIESIDVLKDAAATSMYGAKGANGVVIITTKAGTASKGSVTYDGKVGVSMLTRKLDLLNADEYMEIQKRAYAYSGASMPHLTTPMENLFYYAKDASGNYKYDAGGLLIASPRYDTDWQKVMTQNAVVNDHTLSFSAGGEKTKVYASLAYQYMNGLLRYTYSSRFSGNINVKSQITDWLDIQAVATGGSYSANNGDNENGMNQGALRNMMEMPPIIPVQYEDGTYGRKQDYPLGEDGENPLRLMQEMKNISKTDFLVMSLQTNLKLYKDLTLTIKGDWQSNNGKNTSYAKKRPCRLY